MADKSGNKPARGEKKSKQKRKDDISFETITGLGGTKEDLRLIGDVGDDDDEEDIDHVINEFETEPIKKDEILSFMKELDIFDHRPDIGKEKKPKKLLTAPVEDDEASNSNAVPGPTAEKKEKKKEKNKFKREEEKEDKLQQKTSKVKDEGSVTVTGEADKKKKKVKEKKKAKVQHHEVSSTTASGVEELTKHVASLPHRPSLLVKPCDTWLDDTTEDGAEEVTQDLLQQCEQFAAKLLEDEVAHYKRHRDKTKKGESNWMRTVLTSGTLTDKMAALTLLVQESPPHNLAALDSLVTMARKKGKREAMLAADTMKNLFVSETSPLPDGRKLIPFNARPFNSLWHTCSGNRESVDKRLMVWHAEDLLRQKYAAFVKALDTMSYDTLTATKEKALAVIHGLMISKPEQEDALLPMLVNKLGDPNHKIASKASHLLIKLVEHHPNMKTVIVGEVERLVYRPNVSERAQYYAMCFLNQIKMHRGDQALASRLIQIFFSFFKTYVTKGEVDSKMMAALLTGVNRAFPYAKMKQDFLSEQMTTLYKIVHIVNFNTSVQALMLLHQVVDPSNSDSDRYFMALYRKLLDPALRTSAKQAQFLNLVFKSLKADIVEKRVKALMKRLLQAGALNGPNFLCGVLIVVSEILRERPSLLSLKKLGKVATVREPHEEILRKAEGKDVAVKSEPKFEDEDSDEEERFVDLPVPPEFQGGLEEEEKDGEGEEDTEDSKADSKQDVKPPVGISSWFHRQNKPGQGCGSYDGYHRSPLHCGAGAECLWELQALTRHYHPSVALFARTVLAGQPVLYDSDPLQDFTLIRFLDRFVYKNPKKKDASEKKVETVGAASGKRQKNTISIAVNSAEFIEGGEESVPEHERYLYRYFSQRAEKKKTEKQGDEDSDAGSVSDTEFDDYLDKHERQLDFDDLGEMDFGADLAGKKGKKGKKGEEDLVGSSDEDMEEDEDDDDFGDLSGEEIDFSDGDDELAAEFQREMEGLGDDDEDDDEMEDAEEDDISGDELKQMMKGSRKRKEQDTEDFDLPDEMDNKRKKRRDLSRGLESMFASADDFADVLEENIEASSATAGTLDDVSNSDKASSKQIAWEAKRDRQTYGSGRRHTGPGKPASRGGKPFKKGNFRGKKPGQSGRNNKRK